MKKIFLALLLASACLVSCDGGANSDTPTDQTGQTTPSTTETTAAPVEIDMADFAAEAVAQISFGLPLEVLDTAAVEYLYPGLPEGTEAVIYYTGGAGAEELSVFRTSDSAALLSAIETHRDGQRTAFASYKPADVEKIDNAVTVQRGEYTVFCISADHEAAKSVIEELLK